MYDIIYCAIKIMLIIIFCVIIQYFEAISSTNEKFYVACNFAESSNPMGYQIQVVGAKV